MPERAPRDKERILYHSESGTRDRDEVSFFPLMCQPVVFSRGVLTSLGSETQLAGSLVAMSIAIHRQAP